MKSIKLLLSGLLLGVALGFIAAPYITVGYVNAEKTEIRFEKSRDTIPLTPDQLDALEDGGH